MQIIVTVQSFCITIRSLYLESSNHIIWFIFTCWFIVLVQDAFKKYIPVVNDKLSTSSVQINIPFATGCDVDNICISELQLKSGFSGLMYVHCSVWGNYQLEPQLPKCLTGADVFEGKVSMWVRQLPQSVSEPESEIFDGNASE
jgi:hypothetical protein